MTKDPLAVVRQSDTLYSVPSPFRVKVRSLTEAACKDATSNGNMSRHLNFIHVAKEIFTLRSTRLSSSVTARDQRNKESHLFTSLRSPNHTSLLSP